MQATANKDRDSSTALLMITARHDSQKDIDHMERLVAYLVENEHAEEIYGEDDHIIGLGVPAFTCKEALDLYKHAKKITKG